MATSKTEPLGWNNSRRIERDLAAEVAELRKENGRDVLVFGSALLVNGLLKSDLVDELRLLVYPVVLGSGKRLFQDGTYTKLKLTETATFKSGVTLLRYGRANDSVH